MQNPMIEEEQLVSPQSFIGIGERVVQTIRQDVLQSILKGRYAPQRTLQSQTEVHTDTESNTHHMR